MFRFVTKVTFELKQEITEQDPNGSSPFDPEANLSEIFHDPNSSDDLDLPQSIQKSVIQVFLKMFCMILNSSRSPMNLFDSAFECSYKVLPVWKDLTNICVFF